MTDEQQQEALGHYSGLLFHLDGLSEALWGDGEPRQVQYTHTYEEGCTVIEIDPLQNITIVGLFGDRRVVITANGCNTEMLPEDCVLSVQPVDA